MSDFGLLDGIFEVIDEQCCEQGLDPASVTSIYVKVGALEVDTLEHFEQLLNTLIRMSPYSHAAVNLEIEPGRIECPSCHCHRDLNIGEVDSESFRPFVKCPECGYYCTVVGGRGVKGISLEVRAPINA